MRYCPSLMPAFLTGELALISTKGKYVSKASSNLSRLTVMPRISLLLLQALLGVTLIVRTLRSLVLTIFTFTVRSTFCCMIWKGEGCLPTLPVGPASLSSISEGDRSPSGGMTSTIKSKKGSALPQKGLLGCTSTMRYPSPFCSGQFCELLFPITNNQ